MLDVAVPELTLRIVYHSFLFIHFGNIIEEEVYISFASEMFMLASHRLPLLITSLSQDSWVLRIKGVWHG
jgi:hypothetical protein